MSIQFPYQPVKIKTPPGMAASHPSGAAQFWRPFIEIRIIGPSFWYDFSTALIDTGTQDTLFPWDTHSVVGASLRPDAGHIVWWRGTAYPLRFADVDLELRQGGTVWRWTTPVGFTKAPLPYVLLGYFGFLQFMDATFRGHARIVELEPNASYPGTT